MSHAIYIWLLCNVLCGFSRYDRVGLVLNAQLFHKVSAISWTSECVFLTVSKEGMQQSEGELKAGCIHYLRDSNYEKFPWHYWGNTKEVKSVLVAVWNLQTLVTALTCLSVLLDYKEGRKFFEKVPYSQLELNVRAKWSSADFENFGVVSTTYLDKVLGIIFSYLLYE